MDLYSLNINIDEEVKSYKIEDKLNDYIAVQKQVIPILENEKFYGSEKNNATGIEIDIGKKKLERHWEMAVNICILRFSKKYIM